MPRLYRKYLLCNHVLAITPRIRCLASPSQAISPWYFWQIHITELLVFHLARNLLSVKGCDVKLCLTAFNSCFVLSKSALSCKRRTLSCKRKGVYLYEHFKITKRYHNYHFFSRNQQFLKNWALNYFFESRICWPKSR